MAANGRPSADAATKRRRALALTVVTAVVLTAFAYGLIGKPFGGQGTVRVADAGGGPPAPPSARAAPVEVSTLSPVATAQQDAGDSEGGADQPRQQPRPEALGPLAPQNPPAFEALGPQLYLSGTNLIEPNRSVVSAGRIQVDSSGFGFQPSGGVTGCGVLGAADYYAIPLRNPVSYSGSPRVHLRFDGAGPVFVTLFQQDPDSERCIPVASGTGTPRGGVVDLILSGSGHTFPVGLLPGMLVSGHGILSTDAADPSYGLLPGLTGV